MDQSYVLSMLNDVRFHEQVLRCTGYPEYNDFESAFIVFRDGAFSEVITGDRYKVTYPHPDRVPSPLIVTHFHTRYAPTGAEPSQGDFVTSFAWSTLEWKQGRLPYWGILECDRKTGKPAMLTYSLRPLFEKYAAFFRDFELKEKLTLQPDVDRFHQGFPQKDTLTHIVFDELLVKCGCYQSRPLTDMLAIDRLDRMHAKLAAVDTLEVLPIVRFDL